MQVQQAKNKGSAAMSTIGFDTGPQQVRTALLSVSDKTGLIAFATRLTNLDIHSVSYTHLRAHET